MKGLYIEILRTLHIDHIALIRDVFLSLQTKGGGVLYLFSSDMRRFHWLKPLHPFCTQFRCNSNLIKESHLGRAPVLPAKSNKNKVFSVSPSGLEVPTSRVSDPNPVGSGVFAYLGFGFQISLDPEPDPVSAL